MLASGYARIQPGHSGARCEPPERHPQRPCVAHAATRASTLARESAPPRAARLPSRPHGAHTRRPLLGREEASLPGVAFLREGRWPRRALPWRWRRERLLAHARRRRLRLRGARRLLSAGPMRHFDMLHIYKENKAMPNQMVQAVATRRYRLSTTGESRSAVILLT